MTASRDLRVLVVDDEPLIADAHAQFVGRVPGFVVTGVVHGGADALRAIKDGYRTGAAPDLVLLDFHLPDIHGLDVCRSLRGAGTPVDVIAVTSTRDLAAVRAAVSLGVVAYLLKPFTFSSLRGKLERYADYRRRLGLAHDDLTASAQSEIDGAFAALRGLDRSSLPGGLTAATLDRVAAAVRDAPPCSTVLCRRDRGDVRYLAGDRPALPRASRRHQHRRTRTTTPRCGPAGDRVSLDRCAMIDYSPRIAMHDR